MSKKQFKLRADEFRPLATGRGACIATDHITVEGHRVGYLYRENPIDARDSGWRIFSGLESDDYTDDPANSAVYDINTIANYDPEIIPLLDAPHGSAYARDGAGRFVEEAFSPPEDTAKRWPPPGFPLVEGAFRLTAHWSLDLPEPFAHRTEDGSIVLWRPGLTLWLAAWNNDHDEMRKDRLGRLKRAASPDRFAEREDEVGDVTRYSYRLRDENEDGPVNSLSAYILSDRGLLQMAIYFDDPADEEVARQLANSVTVGENA